MYAIIIEYGETPTEVIGPFDSEGKAQGFADRHELGGYSIIGMGAPDGYEPMADCETYAFLTVED
ncbi:MAG: hypothetical protein ACLPKB_06710 [Xanthobacteraceae bacterium]